VIALTVTHASVSSTEEKLRTIRRMIVRRTTKTPQPLATGQSSKSPPLPFPRPMMQMNGGWRNL
jgi:hypothetical protein